MERLDKVLANLGYGSRKEVKLFIKKGNVEIDGEKATDSGMLIEPENCTVKIFGKVINYRKYIYLMMNKPAGVVSATFDNYDKTVIDLLSEEHKKFNPFPVGRLDKDTVGLLIITNDGEMNHKLISPKFHVDKTYYAVIDKMPDEGDIKKFREGITLNDGYKCMPAKLRIIVSNRDINEVEVTIHEGKFHQVKRMFESVDKSVLHLKRISFGSIKLDENIEEGSYRRLSEDEIEKLRNP